MLYTVEALAVPTGNVVGTYKTLLHLKCADTLGYRFRLRELHIGPGGEAAQDVNCSFKLARTNNAGDGTGTAVTPNPRDLLSRAAVITCKKDCSAEPTTYESVALWAEGVNARGTYAWDWWNVEPIIINRNTALGLLATPGEALAVKWNISMLFEEF